MSLLFRFGLLAVALMVLAGCVQTDAQRIRSMNEALSTETPVAHEMESAPVSAEIRAVDLEEGDCINSTLPQESGLKIDTVEIVACLGEWQYRVLNSFEVVGGGRYPGKSYFDQRAYENCDRRFNYILYPLAESWNAGDRKVDCIQDSFGLSVSDPGRLDRLVRPALLKVGECVKEKPEAVGWSVGQSVELVECSGEWDFRIGSSFEADGPVYYPGEDHFVRRAYEYEECDRLYSDIFPPDPESWSLGLRTVRCVQQSFGLSVSDPGKLDRLVNANHVEVGECLKEAPETGWLFVEVVDCAGEWEFRVLSSFEVADLDVYPGEDYFFGRASEDCARRYDSFFYPDAEVWSVGVRRVSCLRQSFGLSVSDPGKLDRLVDPNLVKEGECFNQAPETNWILVEVVECGGEWEFRVLSSFEVADLGVYPGEDYFFGRASEDCARRYDSIFYPLAETWNDGDRTVICLQENLGLSISNSESLVDLNSVKAGDCFNEVLGTGGRSVELVECSGEWERRVLNSFEVEDFDVYPGEDYFVQRAQENCDPQYGEFLYPLADGWELGDRSVVCLMVR